MNDETNPFGTPDTGSEDPTGLNIKVDTHDPNAPVSGEYFAKVVDFKAGDSKNGKPMITWDFVITDGPHTGYEQRSWTLTNGKAAFKLKEIGRALGILKDGWINETRTNILNRKVLLKLEEGEYNGEKVLNVSKFMAHPDGPEATSGGIFNSPVVPDVIPNDVSENDIPF